MEAETYWRFCIQWKHAKHKKPCEKCQAFRSRLIFTGDRLLQVFPKAEALSETSYAANVHEGCTCLLHKMSRLEDEDRVKMLEEKEAYGTVRTD